MFCRFEALFIIILKYFGMIYLNFLLLCRWDKSGNLMEVLLPLKEEEYSDEDMEGKERDGLEEDTGVTGR
jgi:hypothetical protein